MKDIIGKILVEDMWNLSIHNVSYQINTKFIYIEKTKKESFNDGVLHIFN